MARAERSAGFVIYRETPGQIDYLLLDYGRHWDFPKGHLEKGEDDRAAALRELREETGIVDVSVVPGFQHVITYFFRDRRKGLVRKSVAFFLGKTTAADADIVLSDEHEAYAFLPFEQAIKRVTFANARQVLRLAHAWLTSASADGSDSLTSAPVKS